MTTPINLHDFEAGARARLDDRAWAYLAGGAADELTLVDNSQARQRLRLAPRVLRPLGGGHTRCTLLGRTLAHPILLAPVAFQRLFHPDGERASALAAAMQGAAYVLSAQASTRLEDVAALVLPEPSRGPLWFQLYLQPDRGFTLDLVQRAEAAGFEALVLTVDAPVHGARDRERRAGFVLPPGVSAVNLRTAPATADALPRLAQALLVDGGIRRRTDVLKALALGAQAVLIGRPAVMALAAGGAQGVALALRLLRDELEIAMALTGCATLADIGPAVLWRD